jgi:glycosyltransferase involved in cell wall biosynthesis
VLTIAIPVRDEAPTIGVLLWRVRAVFQLYPREYEVLVFNDGSTDSTAQVLEPYTSALPCTVLGGPTQVGYARAVDALLREASRRTRYPRRDAVILMQGDFTDQPEHIPELVRRFEGGADVVVAERVADASMPAAERRLRRLARWIIRPTAAAPGVADPFSTFRLIRLSTVRDLIKARGDAPLARADGWAANVELLLTLTGIARRVESVPLAARYDVRPRATRRRVFADALHLLRDVRALRRAMAAASRTPPRPPRTPSRDSSRDAAPRPASS